MMPVMMFGSLAGTGVSSMSAHKKMGIYIHKLCAFASFMWLEYMSMWISMQKVANVSVKCIVSVETD